MPTQEFNLEIANSRARRSLGILLFMMLYFCIGAMLLAMSGELRSWGTSMFRWGSLVIACCVGAAASGLVRTSETKAVLKALAEDELRQQSLNAAYRFAFFSVLLAQLVLALLAQWLPVSHVIGFMVPGTLAVGVACFIGCFLWLDR